VTLQLTQATAHRLKDPQKMARPLHNSGPIHSLGERRRPLNVREMAKEELVELTELRSRVAELERLETGRAEEMKALQENSSMPQSLLRCSPEPIVVYDAEGRLLFLNAAFTTTFGWSNKELQDQRIDYVPEDCLAQTRETLERSFKGEHVPPFDTKRLTKDGRIIDVHISSAPFTNSLGQLVGHIVTLRDITERKRMEQALRESEIPSEFSEDGRYHVRVTQTTLC
jgi:PAS domain S-box-containing protein